MVQSVTYVGFLHQLTKPSSGNHSVAFICN